MGTGGRIGEIHRTTQETDIRVTLDLDGRGDHSIRTGVGFFDHMLSQLARHGLWNLDIEATGDLEVDQHHVVEDTGIALGQAFANALGTKEGIRRFGWAVAPMDESLVLAALDISGRGMLTFDMGNLRERVGEMATELVPEFYRAFAANAGLTLHVRVFTGANSHHKIEASFKALALALRQAVSFDDRVQGVPSTKGVL